MEAVAPSHDPWCSSRSEAYFAIAHLRLQGLRNTWRSFNSPAWRASAHSANPHASLRLGIGSAAVNQVSTRFNTQYLLDFEHCHVCRGSAPRDSNGETAPEEEDHDKVLESTPTVRNEGSLNAENKGAGEDDWRAFRARLVVGEQAESAGSDHQGHEGLPRALSKKWAHPIPFPETGCLLVATEKLDGQAPFERSVILLLRLGSGKPQDGPFGIILNRPILHMTKESEPITERMAQMLRNCRLFYGGPLPADIFLLMQMTDGFNHLEEIMPGVYYGYAHGLQQVADLTIQDKILNDFRFYVGYAGWDFNQLKDEIAEALRFKVVRTFTVDVAIILHLSLKR
ncbi:hypothetical protein GOP47_0014570 [Adiantum capillus-veneris]|uniref:Transcriptional regulator n=1 Tax=Adiantum capillus-veneris TaxID=13818 RepID=A0A9D4UMJ6_ADICA|nr:hypothetical protein GOP47_0014570 [Adiantum capillus-veneris]